MALRIRAFLGLLASACLLIGVNAVADETLVVVSVRQYQTQGPSYIHLYLYSLDGKLKKVLTHEPGCNDLNPIFSWDGKSILFDRRAMEARNFAKADRYVLDIATGALHRFGRYDDEPRRNLLEGWTLSPNAGSSVSSDGRFTITQRPMPKGTGDEFWARYHDQGHVYYLTESGNAPVLMETMPGFLSATDINGFESFLLSNGSPFAFGGDFRAVFLWHHVDVDDNQTWGFDLRAKRWTMMTRSGAEIYHPPAWPGVFVDAWEPYQPLTKTTKMVNCSYLEWWDDHFHSARFSPPLSIFYGAAILHPPDEAYEIETYDGS